MEFVCLLLFVGAIWWAIASYRSDKESKESKEKQRTTVERRIVAPAPPPWRVSQSLWHTQEWLRAVKDATDAADRAGAAVPLRDIYASVDEGWSIAQLLTNKVSALRQTRGDDWVALPAETQRLLDSDAVRLDQLNHNLAALRDDITNMIAAVGWADVRIEALDDHLRATRYALQQFPR